MESHLWPESNMGRREKLYAQFRDAEGGPPNAVHVEAYRENRNGRTFSTDVMEELFDTLAAFAAARMQHEWESTGRAPHRIRINVDIEIES